MVLRVLLAGGRGSRAFAGPNPSRQPITSEFKSIPFECESFGSLLAHLALKHHLRLLYASFDSQQPVVCPNRRHRLPHGWTTFRPIFACPGSGCAYTKYEPNISLARSSRLVSTGHLASHIELIRFAHVLLFVLGASICSYAWPGWSLWVAFGVYILAYLAVRCSFDGVFGPPSWFLSLMVPKLRSGHRGPRGWPTIRVWELGCCKRPWGSFAYQILVGLAAAFAEGSRASNPSLQQAGGVAHGRGASRSRRNTSKFDP